MKPGQADQQFIHGLILFQMGQLKDAYGQFKKAERPIKLMIFSCFICELIPSNR